LARLSIHYAESGSLTLCAAHLLSLPSDPAFTSNALAIRIVFPLVRATSVPFNRPGRPGTLGKPKVVSIKPYSSDNDLHWSLRGYRTKIEGENRVIDFPSKHWDETVREGDAVAITVRKSFPLFGDE
jgi:hypothetical protein